MIDSATLVMMGAGVKSEAGLERWLREGKVFGYASV